MARFIVRWISGEGEYEAMNEVQAKEFAFDDMDVLVEEIYGKQEPIEDDPDFTVTP